MKIETLKQSNKRKYIVGSIIVVVILATITYIGTRAKYRVTNSMQLASGIINYSPSDLELVAIKIQNSSNEYDNSDKVPSSGYELNTTLSVCKVGETKQDVTITYENGKVSFNGLTTKGTKCEIYFDKKPLPLKEAILANNTIDTSRSSGSFSATFTEDTAGKIFSAEDDDGKTYFFAGSNPNNWVQFGGFYWRIIRINGDGSIRLIYNGSTTSQTGDTTLIGTSKFSHKDASMSAYVKDNAYVGYMYGTAGSSTYAATHANINSSEVKNILDNWYTTNLLASYSQFIDKNAGFCGDRTIDKVSGYRYTGDGYGTNASGYAPSGRLYDDGWKSNQTATYKCNQVNDFYTTSSSSKGNKALTYPIGLITSDEIVYIGGKGGSQNQSYWLYTNQDYWTMSPVSCGTIGAVIMGIDNKGSISNYFVGFAYGIRPVINLKADVLSNGSGTTSDPYRIA